MAWSAWLIGHKPNTQIISASYSNALSYRHFSSLRTVIQSDWYQKCCGYKKLIKSTKDRIQTTEQGFCFATSVGGTLTGEGGDYIIVDDPHKPNESHAQRQKTILWFQETLSSRLNSANGAIVVVMQRIHDDDLSGFLLSKKQWTHLQLPALADERCIISYSNFSYTREKGEALHVVRLSAKDLQIIQEEYRSVCI